ncbi:putative membrane protein YkoI [Streptomyces canus]|uniref:PepSY domain-containing protein n=1 Tax=Streptomyces canus TaxID=58343 RepID=UPI00277E5CFF|nr:PepSY domain-containing protein [Streptomyces canus]MDQ0598863.1 putative membrane protein YkoI [Streptomyces canus]
MKRNIVIATLTAAALVTGGTVAAFAAGDDDTTAQRQASAGAQVIADRDDVNDRDDDANDDRTATAGGDVTAAEAIAAALKHTPGTAVSADVDDDGADAGTWDVDVVKGDGAEYSVKVAPDSGEVLGAHRDTDDGNDSEDRAELAALKGAEFDAREIAKAAAAKGTVTEVGVDDDNGTVAWSVETVKNNVTSEWKGALDTGKLTQDQDD